MCSQDNGDMKKQHALFKQYGTINDWIAVSYTHLDVYKRQAVHCVRHFKRILC